MYRTKNKEYKKGIEKKDDINYNIQIAE